MTSKELKQLSNYLEKLERSIFGNYKVYVEVKITYYTECPYTCDISPGYKNISFIKARKEDLLQLNIKII